MEGLVLHEHHVTYLEATNEVFNRWTKVTTTSPNIFNEGNLIRVDLKFLCQPTIVELDALILEEYILVWIVENLDTQHYEATVMSSCQADVVEIIESHAELWANQRISRRIQLSGDAVRLETVDASCNVVNIISPASNNWVSLNGLARYFSRC